MAKLPTGLYDTVVTRRLARALAELDSGLKAETEPLEKTDANIRLARHMRSIVRQVLLAVPEDDRPDLQAQLCNELLETLRRRGEDLADDTIALPSARRLTAVYPSDPALHSAFAEPLIPLSESDLLVNARGEPGVGAVLLREISSADRIDLLVAFIRWNGFRVVEPAIARHLDAGKPLRVITTTYLGATERRTIDHLSRLGAEIHVSYDTESTRLHAKAWLFHRDSGFSTAFIGSSNLSAPALLDGLEWNVRLSQVEAPAIVEKFAATFESYWLDPSFVPYDPARDRERFDASISTASREQEDDEAPFAMLDVEPREYQRDMLDQLRVERFVHGRWRNLVVAATGTGKTIVAALDYRSLCEELNRGRPMSLLFVAHRKEILKRSRSMFRQVMRDGTFGELYVDGSRPDEWRQVFASVQSLAAAGVERLRRDTFDVVIVDEFHHSAAPTYEELLRHLTPRVLLGLTATPERADGQSVLAWFNGRMAVELRLWDALEQNLLAPFHYFGVSDETDLSNVSWSRGRYDEHALERLYTADDARVRLILGELGRKLADVAQMRALGFCVSVAHAEFMARKFRDAGIPAEAITGESKREVRDDALRKLRQREVNAIFCVDVFNEGVDVPGIDTVLFLRPTESPTVFLQQLGRGLRKARDKDCLTVLDFIGNANRNFRFDLRYRAVIGGGRKEVEQQIESGFPFLPAGCSMQLDRVARETVLRNLRESIRSGLRPMVAELRSIGHRVTLGEFLERAGVELDDIYRPQGGSWTRLVREAGLGRPSVAQVADGSAFSVSASDVREPDRTTEEALLGRVRRLLHMDDVTRIQFLRGALQLGAVPPVAQLSIAKRRMLESLLMTIGPREECAFDAAIQQLWSARSVREELRELFDVLEDRTRHRTPLLSDVMPEVERERFADVPLSVHATYTREEVLTALGQSSLRGRSSHREGPLWHEPTRTDWFFVTLEKSERYYSPSTRYRDYAISPDQFHWESQSRTREASPTGQRYIHHAERGSNVMLFVRRTNKLGGVTIPFTFLGPMTYVSHTGERPMSILWRLRIPMPLDVFRVARVAAGA
ncbi:MAG: DUF3427 domain-containing protein [Acidobacteria bacterium]|nr:DUF3427 domain-containing protein [Acidobacteriota bacterium]